MFKPLWERLRQFSASLRVALMLTVMVGIAVPAAITVYVERVRLTEQIARQLNKDLKNTSELFANGVKDAVWQMSKSDADAIVAAAFADPRIFRLEVHDKNGKIFTEQQRPGNRPAATRSHSADMIEDSKIIGSVTVTMDEDASHRQLDEALDMSLRLVLQPLLGALLLIGLLMQLRLIRPVQRLVEASATLARGELETPIQSVRTDEIGQLARSMDSTRQALAAQIKRVADLADISTRLQKAQTISELCSSLLGWLGPRLAIGQASLYVADDANARLDLVYGFALPRDNPLPDAVAYGDGLLGQCAIEKRAQLIDRPAADYLRIESGLGSATPRAILIQPLLINDTLLGVLELALLEELDPGKQLLLDRLLPTFALCMEILERNQKTRILLDETQRQAHELEAQKSVIEATEIWYRSIIESAPDGMIVTDERGVITLVNPKLESMFGYPPGELVGKPIEVLVPASIGGRHVQLRDGFIQSPSHRAEGTAQFSRELQGVRRDGSPLKVAVVLAHLPAIAGRGNSVCATVRSVA